MAINGGDEHDFFFDFPSLLTSQTIKRKTKIRPNL